MTKFVIATCYNITFGCCKGTVWCESDPELDILRTIPIGERYSLPSVVSQNVKQSERRGEVGEDGDEPCPIVGHGDEGNQQAARQGEGSVLE